MEFYYIQNQKIEFSGAYQAGYNTNMHFRTASVTAKILPKENFEGLSDEECEYLRNFLQHTKKERTWKPLRQLPQISEGEINTLKTSLNWNLKLTIGLLFCTDSSLPKLEESCTVLSGEGPDSSVDRLHHFEERYGFNLQAKVILKEIMVTNEGMNSTHQIHTLVTDYGKIYLNHISGWHEFCFPGATTTSSEKFVYWPNNRFKFVANCIVVASFRKSKLAPCLCFPLSGKSNNSVWAQILRNQIASDVAIKAVNGKHMQCHKAVLIGHSRVFESMLNGRFVESFTGVIDMPDVSEDGAKAFLEYLYVYDITAPNENCRIAFELFQAAHKYDIQSLEQQMKSLILSKPMDWFERDAAMQIYLFARNVEGCEDLILKLIKHLVI